MFLMSVVSLHAAIESFVVFKCTANCNLEYSHDS